MIRRLLPIGLLGLIALQGPGAYAFPDKDIHFIVPYNPGGGFDRTVRTIAPFMEKHLPNKVTIVPENLPGAGGRKGAAAVYRARPDGYTIGIFNMPGFAIPAVLGQKVGYDLTRITWLGRVEATQYVMLVSGESSIHSIADMKALGKPVKFAATGFGSSALAAAQIAAHVIGISSTYLPGYKNAPGYMVAVVRGDGDAAMGIVQTARKFVKSGDLRAIVSFEPKSSYAGVGTIAAAGYPELEGLGIERIVGAPPGLPADVRDILRGALAKALKDPGFIAQAAKSRVTLDPLGGEAAAARVQASMDFYKKYKPILKPPG